MSKRLCIAFGRGCSDDGIAIEGSSRCPAHTLGWRKGRGMRAPVVAVRLAGLEETPSAPARRISLLRQLWSPGDRRRPHRQRWQWSECRRAAAVHVFEVPSGEVIIGRR